VQWRLARSEPLVVKARATQTGTHSWPERWGIPLCFGWGFAEATVFFIVPDVAVGAVSLFAPQRSLRASISAVVGAAIGGSVLYVMTRRFGESTVRTLRKVPAIPPGWWERVASDLRRRGGRTLVVGSFSGVPYKIYAVEMALEGFTATSAVSWTVAGRASRLVPFAVMAGMVGRALRVPSSRHPVQWLSFYAVLWAAFYGAYLRAVTRQTV
jgi:membrane protein YqaA with SNARE-associated domain